MNRKGWSRISLRLVFVIVTVAAAYSGGRSSMAQRANIAEVDASKSRQRAAQLESDLRLARAALATIEVKPLTIGWTLGTRLPHNRWTILPVSPTQYNHGTMLDQLGVKLVVETEDGKGLKVISKFSSSVEVNTWERIPGGYLVAEGTQEDHQILVQAGIPTAGSGIARLLPHTLVDALARAEAGFVVKKGQSVSDLQKTHFSLARMPNGQPTILVAGAELKSATPVQASFDAVQRSLPTTSSAQ